MKLIAAIFLFVFSPLFVLPAQTIDLDGVEAEDEFRTGVMLFNSGYYNQAYMRFEKALSIKPENRLYRFWLGRSLLQNGYYSAAREVWMRLIQEGYKADFLQSRVDFLSRIYCKHFMSGPGLTTLILLCAEQTVTWMKKSALTSRQALSVLTCGVAWEDGHFVPIRICQRPCSNWFPPAHGTSYGKRALCVNEDCAIRVFGTRMIRFSPIWD